MRFFLTVRIRFFTSFLLLINTVSAYGQTPSDQVITDAGGKASVGFFNADGLGNYKVVVEGINEQGHIGRSIYRYKVK